MLHTDTKPIQTQNFDSWESEFGSLESVWPTRRSPSSCWPHWKSENTLYQWGQLQEQSCWASNMGYVRMAHIWSSPRVIEGGPAWGLDSSLSGRPAGSPAKGEIALMYPESKCISWQKVFPTVCGSALHVSALAQAKENAVLGGGAICREITWLMAESLQKVETELPLHKRHGR